MDSASTAGMRDMQALADPLSIQPAVYHMMLATRAVCSCDVTTYVVHVQSSEQHKNYSLPHAQSAGSLFVLCRTLSKLIIINTNTPE